MSYEKRCIFYKEIEEKRGKPLFCYVTGSRPGVNAQMSSDVISEIAKQLNCIDEKNKEIDILIASDGGDATVSWRIISMIRERFTKVNALIPFAAYSAATLFALGCDELLMHPFANLGPVDPQLIYRRKNNGQEEVIHFGSEDLRNYFEYIKSDVGIQNEEQLQRSFELVCKDVGSIPIGSAKRGVQLALSMGEKLLKYHMKDEDKAKSIASKLNSSYYHHGYPLGRKEAKEIGLPIAEPNGEIEDLLWKIWLDFEDEMECKKPFNPYEIVLSDPAIANVLNNIPQAQIPANLPQQVMNQIYNQIIGSIQIVSIPPIEFNLFLASVESVRCKSHYRNKGQLTAHRKTDMSINIAVTPIKEYWE